MKKFDFLLIGGDKRMSYCLQMLREQGHNVNTYLVPGDSTDKASHDTLKYYMTKSTHILCPTPFTKDSENINISPECSYEKLPIEEFLSVINKNHTLIGGAIPKAVTDTLNQKNIPFYDLMTSKSLTYANAYLTAEGLLKYIIETVPFSITGSQILVLGYGKCGSAIAKTLKALGGVVTVYNRNKYYDCKAKAVGFITLCRLPFGNYLSEFDIIINTIPNIICQKEHLSHIKKTAFIFETASSPGGFDLNYINDMKLQYKNCPGIPGKTSPMTAAGIMINAINEEFG